MVVMDSEFVTADQIQQTTTQETPTQETTPKPRKRMGKKPNWRGTKMAGFIQAALEGDSPVFVDYPISGHATNKVNLNNIIARNKLELVAYQDENKKTYIKKV